MRVGQIDLVDVSKRVFKEVGQDDVNGLAAELAYRFFLTLFPFFIFLAALGGFMASMLGVDNPTNRVMNQFGDALPSDAASIIRKQLEGIIESENGALLSIGMLGAIWTASGAFGAVMKALNRVYDITETRSMRQRYPLAIGLTLLAGSSILVAFTLLFIGQVFGEQIFDALGVGGAGKLLLSILRWPTVVLLLLEATAFMYWAAPNTQLPFKFITPGAVLFVAVWLTGSALFGLYVANFGSYNATYGALGGVVVLLFWFYLSSMIFLVGAELNAVLDRMAAERKAREAQTGSEQAGGRERSAIAAERRRVPAGRKGRVAPLLGALVAGLTVSRLIQSFQKR